MAGEVDYIATFTIHHPDGDIVIDCSKMEGGDPEPDKGVSRNPVTGKTKARGGLRSMSDMTISAEIDLVLWQEKDRIEESAGIDPFTAVKQMVDGRRAPIGDEKTRTGMTGTPNWGAFDIEGGDNNSMLEIESGVDDA